MCNSKHKFFGHVTREEIPSSAFSQCFQTPNPGGPGHLLVRPERAPLPVLLRPASPRPAAREAERDGSPEGRVHGQRPEAAEGGVWAGGRRVRPFTSCRVTRTMEGGGGSLAPASQLGESAGKPLADVTVITFGLFAALISVQVRTETPDFCVHYTLMAFF